MDLEDPTNCSNNKNDRNRNQANDRFVVPAFPSWVVQCKLGTVRGRWHGDISLRKLKELCDGPRAKSQQFYQPAQLMVPYLLGMRDPFVLAGLSASIQLAVCCMSSTLLYL